MLWHKVIYYENRKKNYNKKKKKTYDVTNYAHN